MPHWDVASALGPLFAADLPPDVPAGFHHREGFITADEESALAAEIQQRVEFSDFEMRGVVARRRVAFFGQSYDAGRASDGGPASTPPLPSFLLPLRAKVAAWAAVDVDAFAMALINEFPPGAPIGWHRDAPQYAIVAGISLLSACRMRFRPYLSPSAAVRAKSSGASRRTMTHEIILEPRSAYLMTGESRSAYEHHIPAVTTLRYSITFRTLR